MIDGGVFIPFFRVKTLHLLRHCKFTVTAAYLSTPHSIKFAFLEYEVFYLAI